jgi:polysaccharide biosynthesis/export protein
MFMVKKNRYTFGDGSVILMAAFIGICLMSSCTSQKQLRYFNDLPDSAVVDLPPMAQEERIVQVGDRLQITIGAYNEESAKIFNAYGGVATSGGSAGGNQSGNVNMSEVIGYLVDNKGDVTFPIIGSVRAAGLTAQVLKDTLTNRVTPYLQNPLVNVKFIVFKFTVLGEVRSPGTFNLTMQRTTILDALGAAHDLPLSAKRHDIQIYRDYNGKRTIFTVDLRKRDILNNPDLFQIKHNDIIYVQRRDSRQFSDETRFYTSLITLAAGLFAVFNAIK